ncbi:surface lipoprotein assembly modifier [Planctomycetota bacterium]
MRYLNYVPVIMLLLVLLVGQAFPEEPTDFERGKQYLSDKEYEKAYDFFRQAHQENPTDPDVNFLLGRAAKETKRYEEAVQAFEVVLAAKPKHNRAKLELAECYYHLKSYKLSRQYFLEVLESKPPEKVSDNIEVFLESIDEAQKTSFLTGTLTLGCVWDSNVLSSPDKNLFYPDTFDAAGAPSTYILDRDSRKESDVALFTSLDLEHRFRLDKNDDLWWWKSTGMNYNTFYADRTDLNLFYLMFQTGPVFKSEKIEAELLGLYSYVRRGGDEYLDSFGLTASITAMLNENILLSGEAKYEDMDYATGNTQYATDLVSDSKNYSFSVGPIFVWGKDNENKLITGFGLERDSAKERSQAYNAYRTNIRFMRDFPNEVTAWGSFDFAHYDYDSLEPTFFIHRKDEIFDFSIGVRKVLWKKLSGELSYTHTIGKSSVDLYEYDRDQVSLAFSWDF